MRRLHVVVVTRQQEDHHTRTRTRTHTTGLHPSLFLLLLLLALYQSAAQATAAATGATPPLEDDATATTTTTTSITTTTTTTPTLLFPPPPPPPITAASGPLDDAACNVEDLEKANDSQLHVILSEIIQTSFFRNFVVDLDHKCPLQAWTAYSRKQQHQQQQHKSSVGGGDASINDDGVGGTNVDKPAREGDTEEEEDEFECNGGGDELDDDAEPLCTVGGMGDDAASFLSSNALSSLSQTGFQSKAQKDTFSWKQQTDPVIQDNKDPTSACAGDEQDVLILPDSFWMDICSNIHAGDGTTVVNLALNPEHNTYYNGTHIWKAIYEENCINFDDNNAAMCLEERVLYRLLSGLHTSTTLSIAMKYDPPSKRKNRTDWQPNPDYFMQKFQHHPGHLRNLHFSYVVLLRALQKASPYLRHYEIRTGDIVEDETASILLKRLLDSAILQTCSNVFSAFDESLMFQQDSENVVALQKNFKGVFHNVSSILDCVQCQQCKLHGKMVMLGYGTALKILFMRGSNPTLTRNELVALINTIAKFSESLKHVRELTHLYWESENAKLRTLQESATGTAVVDVGGSGSGGGGVSSITTTTIPGGEGLVDTAVGAVAALGQAGYIDWTQEANLIEQAFQKNPELLILSKHYGRDITKFADLVERVLGTALTTMPDMPDAIVVGSGLAGLATALNILDRGGRVTIIEKEHLLGGNSNKASSGINACCPQENYTDTMELFMNDTIRSAGKSARPDLIEVLVENSASAVGWLKDRVGVDLSLTAQLGGHSSKRTHRPSNGMVGAEIIYGMQKAIRAYEKTGRVKILIDTKVVKLLTEEDGTVVVGVEISKANGEGPTEELRARNVVLATGGFAADRSSGSYLEHYRPELLKMPTTAGEFSTGDGVTLATALGAGTVDMDKVQVHPTGWVDPADPDNTSKILAAELMRGVGGLLINNKGQRFCNELGTRAYVTKKMLSHDPKFAETGKWDVDSPIPTFSLVLSSSAAADAKKHVDLYTHKGLLTRLEGVTALAKWMGLPKATVVATLNGYQTVALKGVDAFGKKTFRGVPATDLENEVFYAGTVTPVLHYCMGGITIDKEGNVLKENGEPIRGLHAAGEVSGGVHGANRLAGNSLLECTVFGSIVGKKIPIKNPVKESKPAKAEDGKNAEQSDRKVTFSELQEHNTPEDCWLAIHGVVYDLTEFADEHPAGAESIHELAGQDGTEAFAAVHSEKIMEDFVDERVGVYEL